MKRKITAYIAALLIVALVSAAFLRPGDAGGAPSDTAAPSDSGWAETRFEGVVYDGSGSIEIDGEVISTIVDGVDIMSNDFYPSLDMTPLTPEQRMLRVYPSIPVASLDVEPPPPQSTRGSAYCTMTDLTAGGGTMVVLAKNGVSTGYPYSIEYWNGDEWLEQPLIGSLGFILPGIGIGAGSSRRFEMGWEWSYGRLTPGYYRVKKNFGSAQFTVLEDGTATVGEPENRFGTEQHIVTPVYSLDELVYESDAIAHVRVTSWLGDHESEPLTFFAVEERETIKGELPDDFVLIQDGTSKAPYKDFPLFAAGDELLVFLDEVPVEEVELRSRGRSYRMVGSCRSLYYIGVTGDWDVVAVPHPRNELDGFTGVDIAPINYFDDSDALLAALSERDPELWASGGMEFSRHSSLEDYVLYHLADLRTRIYYCIMNPPYLGDAEDAYQPLPELESDFAGVPEEIVTTSSRAMDVDSLGDCNIFRVDKLRIGDADISGYVPTVCYLYEGGSWAITIHPFVSGEIVYDDRYSKAAAGTIEKLDENGEWQFYDELILDKPADDPYTTLGSWNYPAANRHESTIAKLPMTDPGTYRVTYYLHQLAYNGDGERAANMDDKTYSVWYEYTVPEPSNKRFELLNVSVDNSSTLGVYVNLLLRANEDTLPYLDPDSLVLEQWLGGRWTSVDLTGSTIQDYVFDAEHPQIDAYDPADTPPHTAIGYELFLRIGNTEELYRLTAKFTEEPDGGGISSILQFEFNSSYVIEDDY